MALSKLKHSPPLSALVIVLSLWCSCLYADETHSNGIFQKIRSFHASDSYRVALELTSQRLRNPEGFDVATKVYDNGIPEDTVFLPGGFSFSVFGESGYTWNNRAKRLWSVRLDAEDYEGLRLENITYSLGRALSPAKSSGFGLRLAGGVGAGLTRSSTYFDSAIQPSLDIWLGVGIQLSHLVFDVHIRHRNTLGVTLDDRKASPTSEIRTFSIGWLF